MDEEFKGPLNPAKLNPVQNKAATTIRDQNSRCYNQNHKNYHQYGALGIRVEYTTRQFIAWYEREYNKRSVWKKASCGRIDHSKNYSLDNIELVEQSENCKERLRRRGNPVKSIPVEFKNVLTGEVRQFSSKIEATRQLNLPRSSFYQDPIQESEINPLRPWVRIK